MASAANAGQLGNLPGVTSMGMGYDVNGLYASPESLLGQPLFDFGGELDTIEIEGRSYTFPRSMHVHTYFHSDFKQDVSKEIEEYREKMSQHVGVSGRYKLFSASLSVDFTTTDQQLTEITYSSTREAHVLWYISLPGAATLRSMLRRDFRDDLNNPKMPAMELFKRYGPYYISEAAVGGRLDYSAASKTLKMDSSQSLSTTAEMSYKALVGEIKIEHGSEMEKQVNSFRSNSTIRLTATGGKPGMTDRILHGPDSQQAFSQWAESLLDYATLMDFSTESLQPIWALADKPERRVELEDAFPEFMKQSQQSIPKVDKVLLMDSRPPMVKAGEDSGSGASEDLAVFNPSTSNGYKMVGQFGQRNHASVADGHTPIFKDLFDLGVLKAPVGWQRVWDDAGSGKSKDYACWRAIPPQGYRALGDVMMLATSGYNPPNLPDYVCVHQSLCADVQTLQNRVWWDKGTGARKDVSLWQPGSAGAVASSCFVGVPNYNNPPNSGDLERLRGSIACVKTSAIASTQEMKSMLSQHQGMEELAAKL